MEKKIFTAETREKRSRMIGIAGSNTGVGCTHFSVMLTNYLAGYLRRKAILLEVNGSGNLEKLEHVCTGQVGQKNPFRILDADYYKHVGPEDVKEVLQRGYDDIVIDFGSVKDGENGLYWRCDKKFLVGSFTEWQQESFREFEMEHRAKQKKSWQSLAVFGSEETRREFSRRFRINTDRIPFSADAFSVTKECGEFFQRIL